MNVVNQLFKTHFIINIQEQRQLENHPDKQQQM